MPSAAAGTGRRSRSNRPESSQEFGRRSVKFSDDLGLDDDAFGVKKRPSTAPGGRNRKDDELGIDDPFTRSLPGKSGKTLPYPTLPYPFFPYPTLLFISLPHPTLPLQTQPDTTFPCLIPFSDCTSSFSIWKGWGIPYRSCLATCLF